MILKICSICGGLYQGYGNNANPITVGRCCDNCNKQVLAVRIAKALGWKRGDE